MPHLHNERRSTMKTEHDRGPAPAGLVLLAWAVLLAGGWLAGCAGYPETKAAPPQKVPGSTGSAESEAPRWIDSYASSWIAPGEEWRIYVKAKDPEGDFRWIYAWVEESNPSGPQTPVRLPTAGKMLDGYLTINTLQFGNTDQDWTARWARVLVNFENEAGFQSPRRAFDLNFALGVKQSTPPKGAFADNFLGMIPVSPFGPNEIMPP
jgi:hypothetical protein